MNTVLSEEIYKQLKQLNVADCPPWDALSLHTVLCSPRLRLAERLFQCGALKRKDLVRLHKLWKKMAKVKPQRHGDAFVFDNVYDLILWVYCQIPKYEYKSPHPTKLLFRGQADERYELKTTAKRLLMTSDDVSLTKKNIQSFIFLIRREFPHRVLNTEMEWQAAARHYGFANSLLDFTTDIDVAAFFATDRVPSGATCGSIFVTTLHDAIGASIVKFVKLPEVYERPNKQRGLFLHIPADVEDVMQWDKMRLLRLNFQHCDPELLTFLRESVGNICPKDEIAEVTEQVGSNRACNRETIQPGLRELGLDILEDPLYPELPLSIRHYLGLASYVTEEGKAKLLPEVLREVVSNSPTSVGYMINLISMLFWPSLYKGTDFEGLRPYLTLAIVCGQFYSEIWGDKSLLNRMVGIVHARSFLILTHMASPKVERDMADRLAKVSAAVNSFGHQYEIFKLSLERYLGSKEQLPEFVEKSLITMEAVAREKNIVMLYGLDGIIGVMDKGVVTFYLGRLASADVKSIIVVTADNPFPSGIDLSSYFDLFLDQYLFIRPPRELWEVAREPLRQTLKRLLQEVNGHD